WIFEPGKESREFGEVPDARGGRSDRSGRLFGRDLSVDPLPARGSNERGGETEDDSERVTCAAAHERTPVSGPNIGHALGSIVWKATLLGFGRCAVANARVRVDLRGRD